jgi:hypothetical protein
MMHKVTVLGNFSADLRIHAAALQARHFTLVLLMPETVIPLRNLLPTVSFH